MNASAGQITLPVFGLYDGYANQVVLTYFFSDGSSKQGEHLYPDGGIQRCL
ncbi:MAG: hypothetical protein H0T11_09005 [Chthoniobacterales bacterium]|nr:hypothetical protein [Chthoniobacterales bacterium]